MSVIFARNRKTSRKKAHGRPISMAVGQNQWYHFAAGAPPILVYFSGDWDVHWGTIWVLTHGHVVGRLQGSSLFGCGGFSMRSSGIENDQQVR